MAGFAGMDTRNYPGDAVMKNLMDNTNLRWTGFYLTPAPSQRNKLGWMWLDRTKPANSFSKREALTDMDRGLVPLYVGQQDPAEGSGNSTKLTTEQGAAHATDAIELAQQGGFPAGSVI